MELEIADLLMLGGMAALAMWHRHIVLYVGTFIGVLFYAFAVAEVDVTFSIPLFLFSGYFLHRSMAVWFGR